MGLNVVTSQRVRELPGEIPELPALVRLVWCCGRQGRDGKMIRESWQNLSIKIAGHQKMGKRPGKQRQGDRSPDGWRTEGTTEK